LVVRGATIGALSLGNAPGRVMSDAELELLRAFADQAALALENARLFAESERGRQTAQALVEVARVLAQELDPDLVSQRIADSLRRVIGALGIGDREGRLFTDEEIRLAQAFADQAALAFRNARLFAHEQAARAEAEATTSALQASEERYRVLVEGSLQGMYIHQDRLIQFANAPMARIFGYASPEDLIGQDYLILIAPQERRRIEAYRAARLGGEPAPTRYETQGVAKDGTPIRIEVLVSIIPWRGRPAILGTFLDVTERRQAQEALERLSQQHELILTSAGEGIF